MSRSTLSTAADIATGTLLILLTVSAFMGRSPEGLAEAVTFLIKLTMPVAGVLLLARGVTGAPS